MKLKNLFFLCSCVVLFTGCKMDQTIDSSITNKDSSYSTIPLTSDPQTNQDDDSKTTSQQNVPLGQDSSTTTTTTTTITEPQDQDISYDDTDDCQVKLDGLKNNAEKNYYPPPSGVSGSVHANGGGFIADTATVDPSVYVGKGSRVLDNAKVSGNVSLSWSEVSGNAEVSGNVQLHRSEVSDNAKVSGHVKLSWYSRVSGNAKVSGEVIINWGSEISDHAEVSDLAHLSWCSKASDHAKVYEHGNLSWASSVSGRAKIYGHSELMWSSHVSDNKEVYRSIISRGKEQQGGYTHHCGNTHALSGNTGDTYVP